MEVKLNADMEKRLVHTLRKRLPYEACGVILGTVSRDVVEASGFRVIRNAAGQPAAQFSFHPEDWIAAFFEAQKNQREIVGFFHSHPSGTIIPSDSDLFGFVPWRTYWIIGLDKADHRIGVFARESDERWTPLPLRVVNAGLNTRTARPASSPGDPECAEET